ncbi:glycosyltransferase family protein [Paracraurococcus lichenis]|uniref:Glycosyltransferase n=1 Tax=Paracraurococcus lichenis TaxID=3064888 RepID=A0ABT9E352_9PROT|nr:glycosyltransferase [Paracraurococcus sp. LOR1-02]MDO9710532.1 glycosyltransferase [Paracraurococcus sp. LOR1-02]
MILIFETNWTDTVHAPGNSATTQVIARAWPEQQVLFHADPSHLEELRRDPALTALPNLRLVPIEIPSLWRNRPAVVSWARLQQEFRIVRAALRAAPAGEAHLVFLMSTTATGSFATAWAARLSGRRAAVQVCLHGNLNDAFGWRSRNPLTRSIDMRASLDARYPVPLRFLVLEQGINVALTKRVSRAGPRTDALPLPINPAEAAAEPARFSPPLRFGYVGLGTPDKGMDTFLRIADHIRTRHGDRASFVHVGRVPDGVDLAAFAALSLPPMTTRLSRAEFAERLGSLHYIVLPFRRGYYDLSASGAVIDALTWLRPIITMRVPLTEQMFADYGDIGLLCEDEAELQARIEEVILRPDPDRYARQVEALQRARATRDPAVLTAQYRRMVAEGYPGLLTPANGR